MTTSEVIIGLLIVACFILLMLCHFLVMEVGNERTKSKRLEKQIRRINRESL